MSVTTGCALNKPYPDKSFHLPNVKTPESPASNTPTFSYCIKVRNARVEAPFEGKSFVYRLADDQWETDFYHEWFTYPRDILTENCVEYLTHKGTLGQVSTEDSLLEADYYLEGTLQSFHLDRRNPESLNAVVKTRWILIPNKPLVNATGKETLWTKDFILQVPCTTDTPQAFAHSTGTALAQTFESLSLDLEKLLNSE